VAKADSKSIGDYVVGLFELPLLSLLKDPLEPVLDIIAENAVAAAAAALALLAIPLAIVYSFIPKVLSLRLQVAGCTVYTPFKRSAIKRRIAFKRSATSATQLLFHMQIVTLKRRIAVSRA